MKSRHLLLGAGVVLSAALAAFGDKNPQSQVAEPVVRALQLKRPVGSVVGAAEQGAGPAILRIASREALIGEGKDEFKTADDNLFAGQNWTPPSPPPAPLPPPPPPSAPPLPFTYIGKSVGDGVWEVYLTHNERTYLVREKTVIDGTYRVDSIAPPILTLTYLPLNQVQQLNIGVFN
jgi:hypothetical protein